MIPASLPKRCRSFEGVHGLKGLLTIDVRIEFNVEDIAKPWALNVALVLWN